MASAMIELGRVYLGFHAPAQTVVPAAHAAPATAAATSADGAAAAHAAQRYSDAGVRRAIVGVRPEVVRRSKAEGGITARLLATLAR